MIVRASVALAAIALLGPGSAFAGSKPQLVKIVKHHGSITATLSYKDWSRVQSAKADFTDLELVVRRGARGILTRKLCPVEPWANSDCTWSGIAWLPRGQAPLMFRDVFGGTTPEVVIDLDTAGAHCCENTFVAITEGPSVRWIVHGWGNPGYRGERHRGRYYFVSGDDRFAYAFTSYAGTWFPVQVWSIGSTGRLQNVTRSRAALIKSDATQAWRYYLSLRGKPDTETLGVLAAWCADEYHLGRSAVCNRQLTRELAHGYLHTTFACPCPAEDKAFITLLHKKLAAWGYARS